MVDATEVRGDDRPLSCSCVGSLVRPADPPRPRLHEALIQQRQQRVQVDERAGDATWTDK